MNLDFRRDIVPFLIATIGEFTALVLWLYWLEKSATTQANVALWVGFTIERIAVAVWVRKVYAVNAGVTSKPIWVTAIFLLIITIAEVAIWDVWLRTSNAEGVLTGLALLFVLIHALHSLEMGAVKGRSPLIYAVSLRTLFYSVMEAVGGAGWLWLHWRGQVVAGALVLLVGLTIEHVVQGGGLKPTTSAARA